MPSFVCDRCEQVVKKPKLPSHRCKSNFTCIDCLQTFTGSDWINHTKCIDENEKFNSVKKKKRSLDKTTTTTAVDDTVPQSKKNACVKEHESDTTKTRNVPNSKRSDDTNPVKKSRKHLKSHKIK